MSFVLIPCILFSFQWYCHFDDDMYVNVPELSNLLQQYDPGKPYYIGSTDDLKYIVSTLSVYRLTMQCI